MRTVIVCILLLTTLRLYAQQKFQLTIAPLALGDDASFPTIQPGLLWQISDRIAWHSEFGIKYRKTFVENETDTVLGKSNGLKLKTEVRYYLGTDHFLFFNQRRIRKYFEPYLALNFFYNADHHNNYASYYFRGDTTKLLTDNFNVSKKVYGFNLLAGKDKPLGKHFLLNLYGGVGMRFRKLKTGHQEIDFKLDTRIRAIDLNIGDYLTDIELKGGSSVSGSLCFGIRFCYQL